MHLHFYLKVHHKLNFFSDFYSNIIFQKIRIIIFLINTIINKNLREKLTQINEISENKLSS